MVGRDDFRLALTKNVSVFFIDVTSSKVIEKPSWEELPHGRDPRSSGATFGLGWNRAISRHLFRSFGMFQQWQQQQDVLSCRYQQRRSSVVSPESNLSRNCIERVFGTDSEQDFRQNTRIYCIFLLSKSSDQ